jgi:hypothetical protein
MSSCFNHSCLKALLLHRPALKLLLCFHSNDGPTVAVQPRFATIVPARESLDHALVNGRCALSVTQQRTRDGQRT